MEKSTEKKFAKANLIKDQTIDEILNEHEQWKSNEEVVALMNLAYSRGYSHGYKHGSTEQFKFDTTSSIVGAVMAMGLNIAVDREFVRNARIIGLEQGIRCEDGFVRSIRGSKITPRLAKKLVKEIGKGTSRIDIARSLRK